MEELITIVPITCTIISIIITIIVFTRNTKKDNEKEITKDVKRDIEISTKLDMVLSGNVELKNETKEINGKFDKFNERLTRVEESVKSSHKRIDDLEKR